MVMFPNVVQLLTINFSLIFIIIQSINYQFINDYNLK